MIDLHCHILPELDDGSQSLEESLAMARMAVNSGVRAMAATPHCMGERAEEVYGTWSLLRQALEETGVPLKLYPGMEIFGTPDTARLLREGKLCLCARCIGALGDALGQKLEKPAAPPPKTA